MVVPTVTLATEPVAWVGIYRSATWAHRRSYTEWKRLPLVVRREGESYGVSAVNYVDGAEMGEAHTHLPYANGPRTVLDHATWLNAKRADVLSIEAHKISEYITWQVNRLAKWTPRELAPVKVAA